MISSTVGSLFLVCLKERSQFLISARIALKSVMMMVQCHGGVTPKVPTLSGKLTGEITSVPAL